LLHHQAVQRPRPGAQGAHLSRGASRRPRAARHAMRRPLALLGLAAVLVAAPARADWSGIGGREVPLQGDGRGWLVRATLNGSVRAPMVTIRYFDLGSNRVRDVKAVVHDSVMPPLDGIVGLSYLNNFSYVIDAKQRLLRLRPGG